MVNYLNLITQIIHLLEITIKDIVKGTNVVVEQDK